MVLTNRQNFTNPTYFINTTTLDQVATMFYEAQNITEVWDKSGKSLGQYPGNQLNAQCNNLKTAGYQVDLNPNWQLPAVP
jgi:hypothetical protein